MVGIHTEPRPKSAPSHWEPFAPDFDGEELLSPGWPGRAVEFNDIVTSRRSKVGGPLAWDQVGNLLWHLTRATGSPTPGRAGMVVERRAAPSAGGLHPISFICIADDAAAPRLYRPEPHAFLRLRVKSPDFATRNRALVQAVIGSVRGCTVRFVADRAKVAAAYEDADSLILRDAGALLATACFYAQWLGLAACPLGFLGSELLDDLGVPTSRFVGVGGVQISATEAAISG